MSAEAIVLLGAGAVLIVTVVSARLGEIWLTEPLVAVVLGVIVGSTVVDSVALESPLILTILELTLAMVLFSDASRIDVSRLRAGYNWPLRMLVIGMPVVIVLGTLFSSWYLAIPFGLALLLAVILAPTDAALAEPVLVSTDVPARVRQALNVESGLNDGLAVPFLLLAMSIVDTEEGASALDALGLFARQLGIGLLGGMLFGWLGAILIGKGTRSGWMNPLHQKIAAVALALVCYSSVQLLNGSGFVAAFVAGGLMSVLVKPRREYLYEFAETEGHALVLVAFFIFGVGPGSELIRSGVSFEAIAVSVVSLVLLRPISIAVSLLGQRLNVKTVVFLGWFGPRGLATIVFILVAVEELGSLDPLLEDTLMVTVAISVLAHGLTAVPMTRWLTRMDMSEDMPEMGDAYVHPMRRA